MADIELLPLPAWLLANYRSMEQGVHEAECKQYARANVEHHTEKLRAEVEALRVRADAIAGEAVKHEARAERLEADRDATVLGHQLRSTAKVSNTAMGAKLREIRQRAIDNGMELQSADEIIREARNG